MMRLNLGSGNRPMAGWVNVDFYAATCDQRVDLSAFPWPWADNSIEAVTMGAVLEHFRAEVADKIVREIHRVLNPGGIAAIQVPHYRNPRAHCVYHLSTWSIASFDLWEIRPWSDPACGDSLFERVACRHIFCDLRAAWLLDWVSNLRPLAWDWLGLPTHHVEWVGRKPQQEAA